MSQPVFNQTSATTLTVPKAFGRTLRSSLLTDFKMKQPIVGFHKDGEGDWVADLKCGHTQHVRHDPPWQLRPWVVTEEGRRTKLGKVMECKECDKYKRALR